MKGVIYFTIITFILSILIVLLNTLLFKRKTKVDRVLELLPGYNCGACGFGSCSGMAECILKDRSAMDKCRLIKNKEEIIKLLEEK